MHFFRTCRASPRWTSKRPGPGSRTKDLNSAAVCQKDRNRPESEVSSSAEIYGAPNCRNGCPVNAGFGRFSSSELVVDVDSTI